MVHSPGAGRVRNSRTGPHEPGLDRELGEVQLRRVAKRDVRACAPEVERLVGRCWSDGYLAGEPGLVGGVVDRADRVEVRRAIHCRSVAIRRARDE